MVTHWQNSLKVETQLWKVTVLQVPLVESILFGLVNR
jgi:hypothetical protein